MDRKEISRKYHVSCCKMKAYEKQGLFDEKTLYNDEDIKRLSLIMSLEEAGLSLQQIKLYLGYLEQGCLKDCKKILLQQREDNLNKVHLLYKSIDTLDYLLKKQEETYE